MRLDSPRYMRRVVVLVGLLSLLGCEKKLTGPSPAARGASPGAVCTEQLSTRIELSGEGFSPLLTGALNEGQRQLELPTLTLTPAAALDGGAASTAAVVLPDDPKAAAGAVRWTSQTSMAFTVTPELALPPALYDVQVKNANGTEATLAGGLLAVPPPALSLSTPDLVCGDQQCTVQLTGTGFLRGNGTQPRVEIADVVLQPAGLDGCAALPGTTGLESCTGLRLEIPAGTLPLGTHLVTVHNPGPASCQSTQSISLTVVPAPRLASIQADLVCVAQGENTLTARGEEFLTIDGATPTLRFTRSASIIDLPTTASDCVALAAPAAPLPGPRAAVQRCTTLTATLPEDGLGEGVWNVAVVNPSTADCTSREPITFLVTPPPTVASARPDVLCSAQGAIGVTITGTGFLVVDGATPTVSVGADTLTATASGCQALTGSTRSVETCTTLSVQVPVSAATGVSAVTVHNPPTADCDSEEAVTVLVVPPPSLTSVVADLICTAQGTNTLTATGAGFLTIDSATPTLRFTASGATVDLPTTASGCAALTGSTSTVQRCTTLSAVVPQGGLAAGTWQVAVVNPAPANCTSTEAVNFVVTPPPTLAGIAADLVCVAEGSNSLTATGTDFLTVDGATPTLRFSSGSTTVDLNTTASNCAAVTGTTLTVQRCTTLSATLPQGGLGTGSWQVSVLNPAPAACASTQAVGFLVAPPPVLTSAEPDVLCTAQGSVGLTLTGTDFLVVNGEAPTVTVGGTTLASSPGGCAALTGSTQQVQRCTTLTVQVPETVATGTANVTVRNPPTAACSTTQAVTVLLTSPPVLSSVAPSSACNAENAVALTLTGSGFLVVDGAQPSVVMGSTTLTATASNCQPVTGSTRSVSSCTTLTTSVPTSLAAGTTTVAVRNPSPTACLSNTQPLTLFGRPVVTSVVEAGVCTTAGTLAFVVSGSDFLAVTEGATRRVPALTVGGTAVAVTTSGCVPVAGLTGVERCASLGFSAGGSTFPAGIHEVRVTNPTPVGCSSLPSADATFTVAPAPTISSVLPTTICRGGDSLSVAGTNFGRTSTVRLVAGPTSFHANPVSVNASGTLAVATFSNLDTGNYLLEVSNGAQCSATAGTTITVVPGPQLFFVDPEIVYNGLTVQATVYGSGFTLPVNDIALLPADGGAAISLLVTDANATNRAQVLMRNLDGGALPAGTYAMSLDDGTSCNATLPDAVQVVDQTTLVLADPAVEPAFGAEGTTTGVSIKADVAASDGGFLPVPRVYLNPSTPTATTVASPVGAVAWVDPATLTALVPATLPQGTYDVIVVNPDGRVGVRTQAFRVTAASQPPPSISSLSPGSLPNTGTSALVINGANFRAPLTVALRGCVDGNGAAVASPTITMTGTPTATRIDTSVSNVGTAAACLVRVTNTDNNTWYDFSALVFTNPAKNLYPAQNGPAMNVARRAPVVLGGDATNTARFLYAIGGDTTGVGLGSVETAPLSLLGLPGPFFLQRQGNLITARTLAGGARLGRWLYVAGGTTGSVRLASVERASILDPARRGEVVDLLIEPGESGLLPGLYYYRVAAMMGASDGFNPQGEELASDPFPVRLPVVEDLLYQVTVRWRAVPGAVSYRVYRSAVAGAQVGDEQVIAEVSSGTEYRDTGAAPISPDRPLPIGSLSRWQTVPAALSVAREGPGVAIGRDPIAPGVAYLYVLGGRQTATAASNTYEYLPITLNADGTQTPAPAFVSGGTTNTLSSERWQLSAAAATNELSPRIAPGATYIYALTGVSAAGAVSQVPNAAQVLAGGGLGSFALLPNLTRAGYATVVAADQVFAFGGNNASPDSSIVNGEICGTGNTFGFCSTNPTAPFISNWNTGQVMNVPRYLLGGTLHGAYIYVAGGTNGTTALSSTEYRIW